MVGALLLQRDDVGQRLSTDHNACGVNRVGARQALERLRKLDDFARYRIHIDQLAQFAPGLHLLAECLAWTFRDQLGDLVDNAVRNLEHAAGVAHGRACSHCRERDDLCDAVAAVFLRDVVDDALAARNGEVDVHVRHRLPARVQKPLEEELIADRVEISDLQRVGDKRSGGAAATRADADSVALRERNEVPDDQEVVREAHLLDRLQLVLEALLQFRGDLVVTLRETPLTLLDEIVERVAAFWDVELGQQDLAELDLDVAALGDLERPPHRLGVVREVERHLRR